MPKAKKQKSGNYRCRVYSHTDANGKFIYKSFTAKTKKEAEYLAVKFINDKNKDVYSKTFLEIYNEMMELKKYAVSPNTYREYQKDINSHYFDLIKNTPIGKIDDALVQKMINEWIKRGLAPKTIRNKYTTFTATIHTVDRHKDFDVILPEKEKVNIHIPTEEEMQRILDTAYGDLIEIPILLASHMGLRRGEIEALLWTDVDLSTGLLTVNKSVAKDIDNNIIIKNPKSVAGYRTLPIPDIVLEALNRHRNDDNIKVTPLTGAGIYKRFKTILKHADVQDVRFHDLRHYYASIMLALNVPDKYAMELMGQATNSTLKNVYQHTMDARKNDVFNMLNEYLKKSHKKSHK